MPEKSTDFWGAPLLTVESDTGGTAVLVEEATYPDEDRYFGELVMARRLRRPRLVPNEEVWGEYGL